MSYIKMGLSIFCIIFGILTIAIPGSYWASLEVSQLCGTILCVAGVIALPTGEY